MKDLTVEQYHMVQANGMDQHSTNWEGSYQGKLCETSQKTPKEKNRIYNTMLTAALA